MESRKVRVLIADDEAHIRSLFNLIVTSLGAKVVAEAADGEQALKLFEQHWPDMVMLDINMPKLDGIEVLKRIIASDPRTLVVMLTARNTRHAVKTCIDSGARHYIVKSATADKLRQVISSTWAEYLNAISANTRS